MNTTKDSSPSEPVPDLEAAMEYVEDLRRHMGDEFDTYPTGLANLARAFLAVSQQLAEARAELGCALRQVIESDDKIIVEHMRKAHAHLTREGQP